VIAEQNRLSLTPMDRSATVQESLSRSQADIVTWQQTLRGALVNSITVEDIQQIVAKQLDKAKKGDETAAKFIISQIVNGGPAIKMSQTNIITDPKTAARIARGES
jgi:hypothetical protein